MSPNGAMSLEEGVGQGDPRLADPRVVRAKTGTLADVITLSGYVLGPTPDRVIAFSVLCNGVRGKHQTARGMADEIVTEIARHLWAK